MVAELPIGEPAIVMFRNAAPGTEMNFVDGDRRLEPVFPCAEGNPLGVLPFVVIEARNDRAGIGTQLRTERVGVSFQREDVTAWADDFIFVDSAFVVLRQEDFPDARGATSAHRMDPAVPAIEVAHDADAPCAGSPNSEVNTANAFERYHMGAELFVSVVVAALAHEVQIKPAEDDRKRISIEEFEGIAEVRASLDRVTDRGGRAGLARRPSCLKSKSLARKCQPRGAG